MTRGRGFTLLEVMLALAILALALGAITYANNAATSQVARITRMTTASFLMEGIVNDIHAYYVRQGFPSNSLEDRPCEVPRDFESVFTCRFDLKAVEMTPEQVQELAQAALQGWMGGGATAGGSETLLSGMDPSKLAMLAPLFGPQGEEVMALCNINLSQVVMGATALVGFLPRILQEVTRRTRQLVVRLDWKDGPRGQRRLQVETFVVSLPEEEVAQMREAERAREVLDAAQSQIPPNSAPPSGPPRPPAGPGGGSGGGK